MSGVNKVILVGNLGKDPEVRSFEGGAKKASFPLATSESFKTRDGVKKDHTEWHNIVLWRGLADVAEKYLSKGSQVYVEGRIRTRSWDDKDGNKKYITEIEADTMTMLGRKSDSGGNSGGYSDSSQQQDYKTPAPVHQGDSPTDDLPF
ncbi:MAG: single-stranded DNA-binding protein [Bacteroidia bacterium]